MRKNKLKELFKAGKPIINSWLSVPSSFSAEVMANQGWDSLTIDMQHGLIDYPNAVSMLQAISTTETTPMARVNWNEPGQIMKILDAGCYGVICPMVSNRKEAENFVQACQYPPKGYRSFGPIRASIYGGGDYAKHADKEILSILEAAKKRNLLAGLHNGTPEYAQKMIDKGFNLVTVGSDSRYITAGAKSDLEKLKDIKVSKSKVYY